MRIARIKRTATPGILELRFSRILFTEEATGDNAALCVLGKKIAAGMSQAIENWRTEIESDAVGVYTDFLIQNMAEISNATERAVAVVRGIAGCAQVTAPETIPSLVDACKAIAKELDDAGLGPV